MRTPPVGKAYQAKNADQMKSSIFRRLALAGLLFFALATQAEHYSVPLLVSAGTSSEPQGVVRILNGTDESGTVEIYAIDDAGTRSGPATFTLNASAAVQFTATDLASGNATLGLTGGIGTDAGDARLEIETDLSIVPLAFVRAADGTLSAMHDTVRELNVDEFGYDTGHQYRYNVPIFNSASDVTQVSRLRLINPGDASASVTIEGRDDSGAEATGGSVQLTLAAGGAQTLTAQQLEAGDTAITGRLGAGTGKWRLTVSSDQPLQVVNIVAASAGYWNNLSTTAVPGAAPADLEAFNERFVGNAVVYVTGSNRYTLNVQTGERFTETAEIDGVSTTYMGSYGYAGIGPDAGRLTLTYDDGDVCAANLYFSTHAAGWFASHCTGSDYPAEGTRLGGNWSVEDDEDEGGAVTDTPYGVDDMLPGVPTSGFFFPAVTSGGSVAATGAGTTIELNNGGYFELSDGTRYTCTATGGCTVANGTVTQGTVAGRAAGSGEVDRFPSFRAASNPGAQTYTVGTAIDALTLPEASGGNGTLAYSLSPNVPGLTFNASTRQLTGTPSTAGTYAMTYTVTDEDDDTDTLGFTITVEDVDNGDTVMIPDAVLRSAIEARLGKAQGAPIYKIEMQRLTSFDPGWLNDIGGIRDLAGLQFATNLVQLTLRSNHHTVFPTPDLSPLAGLTKLTRLNLAAFNNIEDPSPLDLSSLAGLVNLSWLDLGYNNISDVSALKGLTRLAWLSIRVNNISDISALSDMSVLKQLYGQDNEIARIESLRGLTGLQTVVLSSNEISDLAPLAANPGLASGDSVDVRNNPLSITSTGAHVPNLRARGVNVRFSEIVEFDSPQTYNDNLFVIPVTERMTEINAHLNDYVDRVLEHFGDVFDFVIFVPNTNGLGANFSVRQNSVTGIGRAVWETGGKLHGVVNMGGTGVGSSGLLDRGISIIREGPVLHELMHRWANFVVPSSYGAHWGFSSANGALGGFDIADLVDHGGGRYSARHAYVAGPAANSIPYAPIELYLAGLVPPEDVPDIWVAEDGAFLYDDDGTPVYDDRGSRMFTANQVSTYTIEDIIAEHGARVPDSRNSQREFRAVVVLLVNEENPATRQLLDVVSRDVAWFGHGGNDASPRVFNFYEATGGRATISVDGLDQLALDNG